MAKVLAPRARILLVVLGVALGLGDLALWISRRPQVAEVREQEVIRAVYGLATLTARRTF